MKGGSNRLPRSVKDRRGTTRKHREREDAAQADPSKVPDAPKELSKIERAVWLELAAQVEELGTYASSDYTAFRLMVETVAETRDFNPRDPPTARVRTRQVASSLLQGFGLVPAARDRVPSSKGSDDDRDEEFLSRGRPALAVVKGGTDG